ncbi:four helix bundle protein [Parapedobacter sp.]|uniref:four helix bundle protein n=1 Tax=Parapedobacter sp. TaxID=1958893 RepID=UPI002D7F4272|nr:four helix bundle protein [Parapedobacter sp.]
MHNFRQLAIWKESMKLAKEIYTVTTEFPDSEKYGIISQMRRCSVSIPSNIAEGSSRNSNKEFSYFLRIALGSSFELDTQLMLAGDLGFISLNNQTQLSEQIVLIQKKITNFLKTLNK